MRVLRSFVPLAAAFFIASPGFAQTGEPLRLPPTSPIMVIPGLAGVVSTSRQPDDVKAQAQKLWAQGAQLNRMGKPGEAWRSLEQARALATGQPWTPKEEYAQSLALRVDAPVDRKSTRLNSSHVKRSRMPSSA